MKKVNRIYFPYWEWECYKNGFYDTVSQEQKLKGELFYKEYLSDLYRFEAGINKVFTLWTNSSKQFLTNVNINRIAWIGQAAVCIDFKISSLCRGGFKLLNLEQQSQADNLAKKYLNIWLENEYKRQNN